MKNNQKAIALVITFFAISLLTGCIDESTQDNNFYAKDTNAFNILMNQYANNIEKIWGAKEVLIAGPKDYVQYENNLQTRVHINFVSGLITIETLANYPQKTLKNTIISTLLMSEPVNLIRNNAEEPNSSDEPFLYGQVLDQENQIIRWNWRAKKFADYLVDNKIKTRYSGSQKITYVEIKLVSNHVDQRANKFLPLVTKASNRYSIDERLILAIMEVESAFNPYAISGANALGLMQVQPHTAGHDVFKQRGKSGRPSQRYLLDPRNNIDIGTAYLSLLKNKYLIGIRNPTSLRYAMIVSYNGGAGSVLRTFSSDRNKAILIINSMTPQQVYQKLVTSHASQESRNYLIKVNRVLEKKRLNK